MTPNFIKPKIIKLENITAAPVVRTDMVLTTSPILREVNILLIQEGVDYIIKKLLFVCGNYLKFDLRLHQRSSMGHFESITDTTSTFIFISRESETQESFKESSFGRKRRH
jgi:hypothetical protein